MFLESARLRGFGRRLRVRVPAIGRAALEAAPHGRMLLFESTGEESASRPRAREDEHLHAELEWPVRLPWPLRFVWWAPLGFAVASLLGAGGHRSVDESLAILVQAALASGVLRVVLAVVLHREVAFRAQLLGYPGSPPPGIWRVSVAHARPDARAELVLPRRGWGDYSGPQGCGLGCCGAMLLAMGGGTALALFNLAHLGYMSGLGASSVIGLALSAVWLLAVGFLLLSARGCVVHAAGSLVGRKVVWIERGALFDGLRVFGRRFVFREIPLDRIESIECTMGQGGPSHWVCFVRFDDPSGFGIHEIGLDGCRSRVHETARSLVQILSKAGLESGQDGPGGSLSGADRPLDRRGDEPVAGEVDPGADAR